MAHKQKERVTRYGMWLKPRTAWFFKLISHMTIVMLARKPNDNARDFARDARVWALARRFARMGHAHVRRISKLREKKKRRLRLVLVAPYYSMSHMQYIMLPKCMKIITYVANSAVNTCQGWGG